MEGDDFVIVDTPDTFVLDEDGTSFHHEVVTHPFRLGMPRKADVLRQLCMDLPRSFVFLHGVRVVDNPLVVWTHAVDARLCTQACMAPAVEWLMRQGYVVAETHTPLVVRVGERGQVHAVKTLRVVREGLPLLHQGSEVCISVYGDGRAVVTGISVGGG